MTDIWGSEMSATTSADELLARLEDEGVVTVDADDTVTTTEDFEAGRQVYYDTYVTMADEEFHQSVADVFGLGTAAAAAEKVAELDVSREEFATFLTLRSVVDGDYPLEDLTRMARMATELGPSTPVPDELEHLDDETYETFVTDSHRAVVTVWKLFCDPCEAMKRQLDEILATFPEGVPVGGLDGEQCPAFCSDVGVDAAPAIVLFEDGEAVEVITGRTDPDPLRERVQSVYT